MGYDSILRHYLSDTGSFFTQNKFYFSLPSDWLVLSRTQKIMILDFFLFYRLPDSVKKARNWPEYQQI